LQLLFNHRTRTLDTFSYFYKFGNIGVLTNKEKSRMNQLHDCLIIVKHYKSAPDMADKEELKFCLPLQIIRNNNLIEKVVINCDHC
jgi:hypothetical protein